MAARPNPAQRGYDAKWKRTRQRTLRTRPACEWPEGCDQPAVDVHHIDGLGPKGPRGHDQGNLQPLCHSHHSQITQAAKPKRKRPTERHPGLMD